jgi:hypothetical protein
LGEYSAATGKMLGSRAYQLLYHEKNSLPDAKMDSFRFSFIAGYRVQKTGMQYPLNTGIKGS